MTIRFGAPRRALAALAVLGGVAVAAPATAAPFAQRPTTTVVHYDSATLGDYLAKWSNPYGLGEMADGHDTRTVTDGVFHIAAAPFRTAFDFSVYDHLKYLGVSNQSFPVPGNGTLTFAVDIAASTPGAVAGHVVHGQYGPPGSYDPSKPDTYAQPTLEGQQAGVVLNMIDFCTGQLFDWFISGSHAFPLIERLPTSVSGNTANPSCSGATEVGLDKAYTQIIKDVPIQPGVTHHVAITYSHRGNTSSVDYLLDGRVVASVQRVGIPLDRQHVRYSGTYPSLGGGEVLADQIHSFSIGHGLFSLLDAFPFQYGCSFPAPVGTCDPASAPYSVSIPVSERAFGQGAIGDFSNFTVVTTQV